MKPIHRALTGIVFAATLVAISGVANADPWGTGGSDTGEHPDTAPHTWCYGPSWNGNESASDAEWNLANQTYANPTYQSSCDLSGAPQTDVKWGIGDLAPGTRGSTACAVFGSSGHCDRNNITIDFAEIDKGDHDAADEWKTACHELGHSVGLTHGSDYEDCMISGEIPGTAIKWHQYGPHHLNHINDWFKP
jgi:hypothetical protein